MNTFHLLENLSPLTREYSQWIIEDQAFSPSYDLAPYPYPPSHIFRQLARLVTQRKTDKESQLADEGGSKEGEGSNSYEDEKAWSSNSLTNRKRTYNFIL